MLAAMEEDAAKPASADKIEIARMKAAELRDLEMQKNELEEKLKDVNKSIEKIKWQDLVDLMQEAKLESFSLEADGNKPRFAVEMTDHYHANIPEENEQAAFKWLYKQGMGDMVKTSFTVSFGLGEAKECAAFQKKLDKLDEPYDVKQKVPWNTLTAWIKGEFKQDRPLSEKVMGMLGATVKKVVNIKPPKKEK